MLRQGIEGERREPQGGGHGKRENPADPFLGRPVDYRLRCAGYLLGGSHNVIEHSSGTYRVLIGRIAINSNRIQFPGFAGRS
jgi:hypothetical protein